MAMHSDMRKLAQNLLNDYEARMAAVADMRTNVRQELNNYRDTHVALSAKQEKALDMHMEALRREVAEASRATSKFLKEVDAHQQTVTTELRQRLSANMLSLREQVIAASQSTGDFLKEIDQARKTMNSEQRQRLDGQLDDLHSQVDTLLKAAAAFVGDLDKSNRSMAEDLSLKLTWQRSSLATNTATFINDISEAHQEMAIKQAQELSAQSKKLHQSVRDLRSDAASFLHATDAAHMSMATAQKKSMVQGRNQLTAEVTATREKLQSEQNAVRTDQAEAAKVWANISQLKQKNRIAKVSPSSTQAVESGWAMVSPVPPSTQVDDFTVIRGIGPAMARRLNDAGIKSFGQLASCKPEYLTILLGRIGKLAKVEDWITQARDLI